jgi:hypothetical protein
MSTPESFNPNAYYEEFVASLSDEKNIPFYILILNVLENYKPITQEDIDIYGKLKNEDN